MKHKNFAINLICQLSLFVSNIVINFFLTPYILEKLGTEAYGFIGLINNFVSYIGIITIALNSMAGRYIALSYYRGKTEEAEKYYSSVFFANIVLSGIVFLIMIILLCNISKWLHVPNELLLDVNITVVFSCINTIISLIAVVYGVAAFIKNKLYKNALSQAIAAFVKVIVIVIAFIFFEAHIWYYPFSAIVASIVTMVLQIRITALLCPELTISIKKLQWCKVMRIIKSGVWVSVESFNKVLQTGLDLLISNLFINARAVGVLSVSKTIPSVLTQITSTIASVFNPELAKLYAQNKIDDLKNAFLFTIRILSFIMIVPIIGFIVFGKEFYFLWLPERNLEEIKLIQSLSVLTVLPLLVNAYVEGLYFANTLTNKIKGSVLISLVFSVTSIFVEIIFLNYTSFNPLYIIAGTSSAFLVIRYIIVTPLYGAYVLKVPLWTFYPSLIKAIIISMLVFIGFSIIEQISIINSWIDFLICCGISGILGYIFVFLVLFNRREKSKLIDIIKKGGKNAKNRLRK